ncbi:MULTISPECIES: dTDP-4-dehydrorhamnose reductase [Colwellia]|uniref:dTDP-4-dehydrorhamnose reductase n=1 Tax=Colwellia marinimaniae TaxID=1513592 RepID=A0ABQ0MZK8_9GAMM|nr:MULTISPECIES: dTDP-4-dehydrorhamnose reductase [Colwellia]GAW97801.1 NAD(P)-dependent oxidoreductase [Colwellia marinimaniae]
MKILITGKGGQLAWELEQTKPQSLEVICLSSKELDITDQALVNNILASHKPDVVINAAAYTAVDKAETEQERAYAVNDLGSEYLAIACKELKAQLIHVSTDFVFDGSKTTPYQTDEQPNPLNVYGASKLAGDIKVSDILGSDATIIRTAWVYSAHGNNFVKTMLRLMAEKDQLGIVYDQVGTPTWAKGLAKMIWALVARHSRTEERGIRNPGHSDESRNLEPSSEASLPLSPAPLSEATLGLVSAPSSEASLPISPAARLLHWTDAGVCSWYDFAVVIQELAIEKGMLDKAIPIRPIPASAYPTPAARPSFSVIDKTSAEQASEVETIHWRKQLSAMMDELAHARETSRKVQGKRTDRL